MKAKYYIQYNHIIISIKHKLNSKFEITHCLANMRIFSIFCYYIFINSSRIVFSFSSLSSCFSKYYSSCHHRCCSKSITTKIDVERRTKQRFSYYDSNLNLSKRNQEYELQEDEEQLQSSLMKDITNMKVKEIKKELDDANINTNDCFEKSELVLRLYEYKIKQFKNNNDSNNTSTVVANNAKMKNNGKQNGIIRIPMQFHSLSSNSIEGNNNIYLRPSPGKFPSVVVTIPSSSLPSKSFHLLVDTACSGIIIRPSVLNQLQLPKINTGVTMTAAGGTVGSDNNVYKISSIQLQDTDNQLVQLDDFIVVGQDIGSLPAVLDGIIGLSFLERYHSVSFDFDSGELVLVQYDKEDNNHLLEYQNPTKYETIAETKLSRSRIGVYIAPVTLDGRGPINMIIDTGAASTFLNWKGVADMNMDSNHPLVSYNKESIGIMGADNNALALTHRFVMKRRLNFDTSRNIGTTIGMFAPGLDIGEDEESVNIDIADLPILNLEAMKAENVGGILGSDLLMRADILHLTNLNDLSSLKLCLMMKHRES